MNPIVCGLATLFYGWSSTRAEDDFSQGIRLGAASTWLGMTIAYTLIWAFS